MKKSKRHGAAPRPDASRPSKPAATAGKRGPTRTTAVPSYQGATKDKKMPAAGGPGPTKAPLEAGTVGSRPAASKLPTGDQLPPPAPTQAGSGGGREQYIRIRIRVREDRLSVIDSHLVDGPLAQPRQFSGPNVYEIVLGDRLLHAETLPDIGVQRSFANPSGPKEQRGHHVTERQVYEFTVRVPANEVSRETVGKMAVRLHRLKDEARTDRLGSTPLTHQFARQTRQVAELIGLPASVLPEAIEARGGRTPSV